MKEDRYLIADVSDKVNQCETKYMEVHTGFLDGHQQKIISDLNLLGQDVKTFFYGGYSDAERQVFIALPEYIELEDVNPLSVVRIKVSSNNKLTHRDYLGSLLGLGLKRDVIGDILVREDGADIIILKEMEDFISFNYTQVGRMNISVSLVTIDDLIIPLVKSTLVTDTVASLRLDTIVASAFGLSRSKAAEAIKRGIVFVDNKEVNKIDRTIELNEKITLRGKGKVILKDIGGKSRKERIYITFEKF